MTRLRSGTDDCHAPYARAQTLQSRCISGTQSVLRWMATCITSTFAVAPVLGCLTSELSVPRRLISQTNALQCNILLTYIVCSESSGWRVALRFCLGDILVARHQTLRQELLDQPVCVDGSPSRKSTQSCGGINRAQRARR